MFAGKTLIVIAHRLQTVRNTDRIVVNKEGAIQHDDRFENLRLAEGSFKDLWDSQTAQVTR